MKTQIQFFIATVTLIFVSGFQPSSCLAQSVGINAAGAAPDASALLDLSSTDRGFLITRADTLNIVSPAFGLMTLSPADSCLYLFNGHNWIGMGGAGSNCSCNCSSKGETTPEFPCGGTVIPIVDVINSTTGKTWMDRNLGASEVATSSNDAAAYGDLYQWGRCSDGHEKRNSGTTATLSSGDTPGHGNFIFASTPTNDWRNPQNNSLWQGVAGINNPCPTGYRIPTEAELEAERLSWVSNDVAGAFASPLKLTVAGFRRYSNGTLVAVGNNGYYWSSNVVGINARNLYFYSGSAIMNPGGRGTGMPIRCIKD